VVLQDTDEHGFCCKMRRGKLQRKTRNFKIVHFFTSLYHHHHLRFWDLLGVLTTLLYSVCMLVTVALTSFRTQNGSCTAIESVFIDISSSQYSMKPVINGLSDHDAQLLVLNNTKTLFSNYKHKKQTTNKL
jgi:hypothetical protein